MNTGIYIIIILYSLILIISFVLCIYDSVFGVTWKTSTTMMSPLEVYNSSRLVIF